MDSLTVPLVHYNYDLLTKCQCAMCQQRQEAQEAFYRNAASCKRHPHKCPCMFCKRRAGLRLGYEAASSRHELYSEATYFLRDAREGEERLRALFFALLNDAHSARWWVKASQVWPISHWLEFF